MRIDRLVIALPAPRSPRDQAGEDPAPERAGLLARAVAAELARGGQLPGGRPLLRVVVAATPAGDLPRRAADAIRRAAADGGRAVP